LRRSRKEHRNPGIAQVDSLYAAIPRIDTCARARALTQEARGAMGWAEAPMTPEDLLRFEAELAPLVARPWACPIAVEQARAFTERADTVRAALLEPARALLARRAALHELPSCLERTVAQLAFWRRVLQRVHGEALEPGGGRADTLLRYLIG
jgi:hypothetical protein